MWVSMGDEQFASPQWYRVVAKNPFPYLRSPRGIQISQDDKANAVLVTLPSDIAPGDWSVALVDDNVTDLNASTTPIISSPFASPNCGPSEFVIPVARLPFNIQPSYKTIRARVIQKALDLKTNHDSLPVFSYRSLGVTPAPRGLVARFTNPAKVGVKWLRSEGLDATAYIVTVVRTETQKEVRTEQTVTAFDEGFVTTEVTPP